MPLVLFFISDKKIVFHIGITIREMQSNKNGTTGTKMKLETERQVGTCLINNGHQIDKYGIKTKKFKKGKKEIKTPICKRF